jgi:hypothetical protein
MQPHERQQHELSSQQRAAPALQVLAHAQLPPPPPPPPPVTVVSGKVCAALAAQHADPAQ